MAHYEVKDYELLHLLGSGSFGEIYQGRHRVSGDIVAIKLEKNGARSPQLEHEYRVYAMLKSDVGFPAIHGFHQDGVYTVLIMDRLGPSLEELLVKCGGRFSLKTTLMIAKQVLHRVEFVHNRCLLHRDVKPENFLIGFGQLDKYIFMIDFGLAKKFKSTTTGAHAVFREGKSLTGTARYASIFNHLGYEQSRRDDLESVGYMLLYFMLGRLPWQGLHADTKKGKYAKIGKKKQSVPLAELCAPIPSAFRTYIEYCRNLEYTQNPDYAYLRSLFRSLMKQHSFQFDYQYDWTPLL